MILWAIGCRGSGVFGVFVFGFVLLEGWLALR
jgi:hypothetical protein